MERGLNILFIRVQCTAFLIRPIWPTYTNQRSNYKVLPRVRPACTQTAPTSTDIKHISNSAEQRI